jgi:hypothetical protein
MVESAASPVIISNMMINRIDVVDKPLMLAIGIYNQPLK